MAQVSTEQTRFWQSRELGGVELLNAHYVEQRFSPHRHDSFVLAVIERGAHRFRHLGCEHVASSGGMILINPDEVHSCSRAGDAGWHYRAFYPQLAQVDGALVELGLAGNGQPGFAGSVLHDPQLHQMFARLHRLLEGEASALQQQTAWREAILLLFQRHARVPQAPAPGREPRSC